MDSLLGLVLLVGLPLAGVFVWTVSRGNEKPQSSKLTAPAGFVSSAAWFAKDAAKSGWVPIKGTDPILFRHKTNHEWPLLRIDSAAKRVFVSREFNEPGPFMGLDFPSFEAASNRFSSATVSNPKATAFQEALAKLNQLVRSAPKYGWSVKQGGKESKDALFEHQSNADWPLLRLTKNWQLEVLDKQGEWDDVIDNASGEDVFDRSKWSDFINARFTGFAEANDVFASQLAAQKWGFSFFEQAGDAFAWIDDASDRYGGEPTGIMYQRGNWYIFTPSGKKERFSSFKSAYAYYAALSTAEKILSQR